MKAIFNSVATFPHRIDDVVTGHGFEEKADQIINSAHLVASRQQIISRIEMLHSKCFAPEIRKLMAERDEQLQLVVNLRREAEAIEEKLRNGSIPEYCSRAKTFRLPKSYWSKLGFFLLLAVALGVSIIEGLNVAWFLRFKTDSFFFGILCAIPIFAFPAVEAVIFHNRLVRPRARNIIMLVQGVLGAASLAAYIYYSLLHADSSLVNAFAETPQGFSTEQLRMAFQILTSVLFSGICLLGADSLGLRKRAESREYRKATANVKALKRQAERHVKAAEAFIGPLEQIEARKKSAILRCDQKLDELKAAELAHTASINKILSQL